ncbi:TetR/AcrR family transcriptional regulator [Kribbella sp. VKM Ac-2568]|uniref:TetR/AcrR family transcriptional regulator n=1 Tax=Kribbella sp. VKM Ac-2568 TaxID=2512219 RepID=UPI0010464083|nr:TetR/AcrR family transcriptional regulator [Kribbella sp. VKM Ac-2568]TCM49442.1 TetR family transcriptional regulator [Kribbella sp. VKM Ac-2568]
MKPSTPQTTSPAPRQRQRRPRGSLTPDRIVEAAERVATTEGFEALTVRAVAADLESSAMALYRHFATKELLVDALLDTVLGRFDCASPTDDWLEDLRIFARSHRRLLTMHPWAVAPLFSHPSPGLNAVRIGEEALRILARGGITDDAAVATFSGIIALNYGWSAFTVARDDSAEPTLPTALAALPADQFPLTISVATSMGNYGSDAHYNLVLNHLLTGVKSTAPEP